MCVSRLTQLRYCAHARFSSIYFKMSCQAKDIKLRNSEPAIHDFEVSWAAVPGPAADPVAAAAHCPHQLAAAGHGSHIDMAVA